MKEKKFEVQDNGEEARQAADFVRGVVQDARNGCRSFKVEHQGNDDGSSVTVVTVAPRPKTKPTLEKGVEHTQENAEAAKRAGGAAKS